MTWANRRYTQEWFGVDPVASGSTVSYAPGSGIRDVQLTLNWNWELSASWVRLPTVPTSTAATA